MCARLYFHVILLFRIRINETNKATLKRNESERFGSVQLHRMQPGVQRCAHSSMWKLNVRCSHRSVVVRLPFRVWVII